MKWTGQCLATVLMGLVSFSTLCEELKLKKIASGYQIPWGIEFIDSANAVITEKNGRISLLDVTQGQKTPLYQVTNVDDSGQGGLLDVALSPITRQQLYFTFSKEVDTGTTVVLATARLQNKVFSDWQELFVADAASTTGRHFGSRIAFDDNNHLYVSIGDRGVRDNGQDPSNHAATILRLTLDGKIPNDNPFIDNSEVKKEIWSFGHRNPQGLFFDGKTQRLWSVEHGPRGGDEINLIQAAKNYGWAKTSHGKEYWGPIRVGEADTLPGIEAPKWVYIPSIAPSSLMLYRGERYPSLNGKLLIGALKLTHINVVSIENGQLKETDRLFEKLNERVRDITLSPDDYLYFTTDNGNIYQVLP
ncbi:PQQ-dependent sugar dehydrogenase [Vibrio vulnificus]